MPASLTTRLAWLVPGSLFAVATLGWGTINLVDLSAHERHHEQQEFTAPIRTLDIDNDKGHVEIIGTDASTVTVDASVSEGLRSGSHSEQLDGDRLVIRATCPIMFSTWCGVDYTVRVPAATAVVSHSSGGGIEVTGMTGDVTLTSSGGGVHVVGGGTTLTLDSSGGGVHGERLTAKVVTATSSGGGVHLSFAEPPQTVKADSSGGGVTVEVPDVPGAYHVEASSSGGGVHTDVRTDPNSPNAIDAHSSGGGVTVRYLAG
jgi:Putative adhesin